MSFLSCSFAPTAVAAASVAVVWMFGGIRGGLLVPVVPWLVALVVEALLFFPQRREGETTFMARARVWRDLKRDPLTWTCLALFALLLVPFVNDGLCPGCDAGLVARGFPAGPPVPLIPFCVSRVDHLNVVLWFALALSSLLAVRHALSRSGKRLVLELLVWNGVALAALGFVQNALGAPGPLWDTSAGSGGPGYSFSTFGYPNMAGDYFTTLFAIAVALWRRRVEDLRTARLAKDVSSSAAPATRQFWTKHYFLIPAAVLFCAAVNTLSRAAIVLVTLSAAAFFVHTFVSFVAHRRRADRVRAGAWTALGLAVAVTCACVFAPKGLVREVKTLNATAVADRVSGRGMYHSRVATEIWKDNVLFGCGGWGYVHFCIPKMTPEELSQIQKVGGINVHNDHLQFLAEHGVVGYGLMAAVAVLLLLPVVRSWRRLAREAMFKRGADAPPAPRQLFALPAPALFILVAAACTFVHAFADCPLRSPAVLTLFYVSLAAIPGFMPSDDG